MVWQQAPLWKYYLKPILYVTLAFCVGMGVTFAAVILLGI